MVGAVKECCPHKRWDLEDSDGDAISIWAVRGSKGKKQRPLTEAICKSKISERLKWQKSEILVMVQWWRGLRRGALGLTVASALGFGMWKMDTKGPSDDDCVEWCSGSGPTEQTGTFFLPEVTSWSYSTPHTSPTPTLPTSLFQRREGEGVFCHHTLNLLAQVDVANKVYQTSLSGFKKKDLLSTTVFFKCLLQKNFESVSWSGCVIRSFVRPQSNDKVITLQTELCGLFRIN